MFAGIEDFAEKAREADFTSRSHAYAPGVVPRAAEMVHLEDVDLMTRFSPPLQDRSIRLNFFGTDVDSAEYLDGSGYYDFARIEHCHHGGATVVFNQCQWFVGPVFHLKRCLERIVGARVNANAYFTPPNAQGFRSHVDDHDVFIIQVSGAKAWTLSGVPPYHDGKFHCRNWKPTEEREIIMNPGDAMYLPEGVAHCARTHGDEVSVHLTCGYTPPRWHNLFASAVDLARKDHVEMLDRLPPNLAERPDDFAKGIRRRKAMLSDDVERAAEFVLRKFNDRTEHRSDPPIAASHRLRTSDPALRLKPTPGVSHRVFGGVLSLRHAATERTMDLFLRHLVSWEWMSQADSFQPSGIPGDASSEEKIQFCSYLHSNGFLQVVGEE